MTGLVIGQKARFVDAPDITARVLSTHHHSWTKVYEVTVAWFHCGVRYVETVSDFELEGVE